MSNNMIYVETDQLKACASEYDRLADQFQNDWKIIESKLKECENYWQGSFTTDMDNVMKKVKKAREDIYENTIKISTFIKSAADLYVKYDGDIAKALQDNPSLNAADYPDNVIASVRIKTDEELGEFYHQATEIAKKGTRNPDGGVSCSALTLAKMQINGYQLEKIGNGNEVYSNINSTDSFDAHKYEGGNCLYDLLNETGQPVNDIVISFPYGARKQTKHLGHAIYIDQIVDGTVYFSDNRGKTTELRKKTVAEFLSMYNNSNGTPIGCVHLKKKH